MAEREQKRRTAPRETDEEVVDAPTGSETGEKLKGEIDEVLESNAEDFVRSYVQKGGQ